MFVCVCGVLRVCVCVCFVRVCVCLWWVLCVCVCVFLWCVCVCVYVVCGVCLCGVFVCVCVCVNLYCTVLLPPNCFSTAVDQCIISYKPDDNLQPAPFHILHQSVPCCGSHSGSLRA